MRTLSLTDLTNYQRQVVRENNHLVKTWTPKIPSQNIYKIIEINSIYFIDTLEENEQRFKATIFYNNYFIEFRDTAKNVRYETINGQGVNKYSIGARNVSPKREMIMVALFYFNNRDEIEQLLNKYLVGK